MSGPDRLDDDTDELPLEMNVPPVGDDDLADELDAGLRRGATSALWTRAVGVVAGLVNYGVALRALGAENFGILAVASSAVGVLSLLDLGLNGRAISLFAETLADRDTEGALELHHRLWRRNLRTVGLLALPFALVGVPLLVGQGLSRGQAVGLTVISYAAVVLQSLGSAARVLVVGTNQMRTVNLWSVPIAVVPPVLIGVLWFLHAPFFLFSLAFLAVGSLIQITMGVVYKRRLRASLPPTTRTEPSEPLSRLTYRQSRPFWVLQASAAIGQSTDLLVVGAVMGPTSAASYALVSRMFNAIINVSGLVLAPLWPAAAAATRKGMRSLAMHLTLVWGGRATLGAAALAVPVALASSWIIKLWSGGEVASQPALVLLWMTWTIYFTAQIAVTNTLLGMGFQRFVSIVSLVAALLNILISIGLTELVGIVGPIAGTLITMVGLVGGPCAAVLWIKTRPAPAAAQEAAGSVEAS